MAKVGRIVVAGQGSNPVKRAVEHADDLRRLVGDNGLFLRIPEYRHGHPARVVGVGGQVDFVTGAQLSEGGRSIIALPATAVKGTVSRIVNDLAAGAGVVTTRAQVDHVVTEYGVASLRGRSIQARAKVLIEIAHPDFRESLSREFDGALNVNHSAE